MKRLAPIACLLALLLVAGCGAGERWAGYTEDEAKGVMLDPQVKATILEATPRKEDQQPVAAIYPDEDKLNKEGLRKVKMQGQDAWEYSDRPNGFCLYVWFDKPTNGFLAQASRCVGVPA